jgi:hypothetical protein
VDSDRQIQRELAFRRTHRLPSRVRGKIGSALRLLPRGEVAVTYLHRWRRKRTRAAFSELEDTSEH